MEGIIVSERCVGIIQEDTEAVFILGWHGVKGGLRTCAAPSLPFFLKALGRAHPMETLHTKEHGPCRVAMY